MKKRLSFLLWVLAIALSPFGESFAWRVPDTGQISSLTDTYGEDADYNINQRSYTKLDANGNDLPDSATSWSMVRDNISGLIWEIKTNDESIQDKDNKYTWQDAQDIFISTLNGQNFGGYDDWRLPTIKELTPLILRDRSIRKVDHEFFPGTGYSPYWTQNVTAADSNRVWHGNFSTGNINHDDKTVVHYVRAVRGSPSENRDNLFTNGDGTLTDNTTGLIWQQGFGPLIEWDQALDQCENLSLAGYNDWRLPNINELQSIVDYSKNNPAINTTPFLISGSHNYWSSSYSTDNGSLAWTVNFETGEIASLSKTDTYYTRCVRGGQNKAPGLLLVYFPVQGAVYTIGDSMLITWDNQSITGSIRILLSRDGGKNYESIVSNTENDGLYEWTITGPVSANGIVKLESLEAGMENKSTSQGFFSITSSESSIALISEEIPDLSNQKDVVLTVIGESIFSYKYKLNDGTYSDEILKSNAINLTNLPEGINTVQVIGRNSAGDWQSSENPTIVSWTIDSMAPATSAVPGSDIFPSERDIVLTCLDDSGSGCTGIYFTTDGTEPSVDSTKYLSPISLGQDTTIKFFATDLAGNHETVQTETYRFDYEAPIVQITLPMDGQHSKPLYSIEGVASDSTSAIAEVKLQITEGNYYVSQDKTFTTAERVNENETPLRIN